MRNTLVPLLIKLLGKLPLPASRALGAFVGSCMYGLRTRGYCMTYKNLKNCMPELSEKELKALTLQSLRETAKTAAEAAVIWHHSWDWLKGNIVEIEGEELLRAELAVGKGLLVLAPHLGNWEVVAPYLSSIAPLTAMYQPARIPALDALILKGRTKSNINMAPTNRKGVCMLLKALQQGTIVGILPDQVPKEDAGFEPSVFFNQTALTMSLVHSLVSRTQCRLVSVFAMRVKGGFKMIVLPVAQEIYSEDSSTSLLGLNMSVEACVRVAPAQYQWEYNRFRIHQHGCARDRKLAKQLSCKE